MSRITESARGEECLMRFPFVCNFDASTVVWMHANGSAADKGMWLKSHDLLGAFGCHACHDLYDRRRFKDSRGEAVDQQAVDIAFWQAHARSLIRLIEKGVIVLDRGLVKVAA